MIKVGVAHDGQEIGHLVEVLYDSTGNVGSFVKADLITTQDVERAHLDVQTQEGSLMTFFFDNGTFNDDLEWVSNL